MFMNEKIAKKVGEAYAFATVLSDTFTNNQSVMTEIFGDKAESILEVTTIQKKELEKISEQYHLKEIVLTKAEKTGAKITSMGEMYVGDDWDDAAEVLEWMSFFVGGAIVHWQLITGGARIIKDEHFSNVAGVGTDYYGGLMEQLKSYAITIGEQRASL